MDFPKNFRNITLICATNISKKALLSGRPCTRQTKAKMAKSRILAKLGWVDQLIGGVDHTKYFCPEVTLIGVRAHPIFELTKKN